MATQHSSLGQGQVNCTEPHLLPADPLQRSPVGHPECALAPQAQSCSPEPRQQPVRGLQRLCRICPRPPLQPAGYTWRNVWFLLGVVMPLVMQHHAPKVCSTNVSPAAMMHMATACDVPGNSKSNMAHSLMKVSRLLDMLHVQMQSFTPGCHQSSSQSNPARCRHPELPVRKPWLMHLVPSLLACERLPD